MPKQFEIGDIIMNNMGEKYTVYKRRPFNTPPAPPGEEPTSDDDVLAGYMYTLNDGYSIHILLNEDIDERGNTWTKDSVAQGVKRKKSNKKRKSNKRRKSNKKRRNYRK
jgi:hypothetical protein